MTDGFGRPWKRNTLKTRIETKESCTCAEFTIAISIPCAHAWCKKALWMAQISIKKSEGTKRGAITTCKGSGFSCKIRNKDKLISSIKWYLKFSCKLTFVIQCHDNKCCYDVWQFLHDAWMHLLPLSRKLYSLYTCLGMPSNLRPRYETATKINQKSCCQALTLKRCKSCFEICSEGMDLAYGYLVLYDHKKVMMTHFWIHTLHTPYRWTSVTGPHTSCFWFSFNTQDVHSKACKSFCCSWFVRELIVQPGE